MIWKKQPVGSKLSDLQNNKASKDTATQSAAGLMSASDKTKLDGIATGATAVSVVNNLNSDSTTSALSAAQGKALNSKIDISQYTTLTTASGVSGTIYLGRLGKQRVLTGYFKPDNIGTNILVATLGSSDKPPVMIYGSCTGYNVGAQSEISIGSNGEIKANVPSGGNNNTVKVNMSWFIT